MNFAGYGPDSPSETTGRNVAWRAVVPAFITVTLGILPVFLTAGLVVQIGVDIGLTLTGLGLLIGAFFGVGGLMSPAMGRLAERLGWATGLRIAILLAATTLAGIGLYSGSMMTLTILFLLGGAANSLGQTASNLAVARCVTVDRHGLFFGLRHASVPMATFLAGIAIPLIALTIGWRWAFLGAAALGVLTALLIPWREQPYTLTPARTGERAVTEAPATPMRLLVLLATAAGLALGGTTALATFFVSYSVDIGIDDRTAGLLLAAGSLCGIATRVVAGWMIDRVREADLTAVASMIAAGAAGLIMLNLGGHLGLLLGAFLGFAAGWGWSGLFTFAVVKDNPEAPAAATGVTATGRFLGAAIGPLAFGLIADNASYGAAWWVTTAALLIGAGLIMYVRSERTAQKRWP